MSAALTQPGILVQGTGALKGNQLARAGQHNNAGRRGQPTGRSLRMSFWKSDSNLNRGYLYHGGL